MKYSDYPLTKEIYKQILLDQDYVSFEDWSLAEEYTKDHDSSVVHYLVNRNLLTKDLFGQAMAEYYQIPYVDFDAFPEYSEVRGKLPKEVTTEYRMVLVSLKDGKAILATDIPKQIDYKDALKDYFEEDTEIVIGYALSEAINKVLSSFREDLQTAIAVISAKDPENAPAILEAVFEDAILRNVSDIHLEPMKTTVMIRFRVDGVLEEVAQVDHVLYEVMVNRIKVLAGLRIDEHFATQDGSLHQSLKGHEVDMRVSIAPITEGEKIVIRILGEYVSGLALSEIGMSELDQSKLLNSSEKPFGMILVTGPTGSGKTTTLYSLVKLLNRPGVNITTIEDPVEYKIPGVNQIQVNEKAGITFARGLRSVVRQDPDIILIGEIRDKETAEIAINAALSGHLVLSTFHSNDAATAVPRLLDMGVEPFLLASTLDIVIGQRLVRTLKEDSRVSKTYSKKEISETYPILESFIDKDDITLYESTAEQKGLDNPFSGQTALFELLSIDSDIEEEIMKSPSASDIWKIAHKNGTRSMFEDGVEKLKLGVTTPNELIRVVEPPKKYEEK